LGKSKLRKFLSKFLFLLCLLYAAAGFGQEGKYVEFRPSGLSYSPRNYYIGEVTNEHINEHTVGEYNGQPMLLRGTVAEAVRRYIDNGVRQSAGLPHVKLTINSIKCNLKRKGLLWHISLDMELTFSYDDNMKVTFTGGGTGRTSADPVNFVAGMIGKGLKNDLEQFDQWWVENKGRIATNPIVKAEVIMAREPDKPAQIVYSPQRPLMVSDFRGPAGSNPSEAAATVSGIGIRTRGETVNGQLVLTITVTPGFKMSESWFRKTEQEPRVLAHEQAHFDIMALYACKLVRALQAATLTRDNYTRIAEELHKRFTEAAGREEDTYDEQTNHGTLNDKQLEWQRKVHDEIRQCGCY